MIRNELTVNGTVKVCGMEIPNVYGGFGENQKVILAKTVAQIHKKELKEINRLIGNHIKDEYFENGVDFIDLKNSVIENHPLLEMGYSKQAISNSSHIYLLSQQGYTLLLKLMNTELSRKQYKKVIREYFILKESVYTLSHGDLQRLVTRTDGIIRRNRETQVISQFIEKGELENNRYTYASITNTTYNRIFGMYAKEIKQYLNLKQKDNLRDFLSKRDLDEIREVEDFIYFLGKMGKKWDEIYDELCKQYPDDNRILPTKEEKSTKELLKCNKIQLNSKDKKILNKL